MRRLPLADAIGLRTGARHSLHRLYRPADLVVLGLGVMIGAGIFSMAGRQAATTAGPGVILSFMIGGIACMLAALCYAELASAIPASGAAYAYAYVIFGEVWAWAVGWALILETQLAAAVVARVWAIYATQTLTDLGIGQAIPQGVLAAFVLAALTTTVALSARIGLRALWVIVVAKLLAIGAVIVVGATHVDTANLGDFIAPVQPSTGSPDTVLGLLLGPTGSFGWFGVFAAAPAIVFAYVGFDLVATASEETVEAPRAVPLGMIRSLAIATVLYIATALVMVGMVPYTRIAREAPLAAAFKTVGEDVMVHVINIGAVLGLTTVILVLIAGQTRIMFAMARDGLLPRRLGTLSRRFHTPSTVTLVIGVVAILLAQLAPVLMLEQLVVLGTLFAFLMVSVGVVVLRHTMPTTPRGFTVPLSPLVPALSVLATLWLMINLRVQTWAGFAVWMVAGLLVYLAYGRRRSPFAAELTRGAPGGRGGRGGLGGRGGRGGRHRR
ncbi:amino acid permease [Nonomuraea africana]|uniref:APA family basic amino acid/polyamine antiporter n=1 Tax=Nonomuraea africana TaxID=46171 RepID=A0ABR9KQR5_9ACTN|nr:amino acid permease [Nonomuraea africana]MBE1564349.1 APA family basic amino acid/polyamine antiporter [Nonomuraea africana]